MKRKISTLMMASAALAVGMVLMPLDATAKKPSTELRVDCDAGQSLQAVLDNTKLSEPVTINVTGVCSDGPFAIRRDVRIIGSPSATLSAPAGGHNVVSTDDGASAELSNLNVDASGQIVGIQVDQNTFARLYNVKVTNAIEPAVNVDQSSTAAIFDSELSNSGTGFQVLGSSSGSLTNSIVSDNDKGVSVSQFANVVIDGNTIVNNTLAGVEVSTASFYGFVGTRGNQNTIDDNGLDVLCGAGGVFYADQPQDSVTPTTWIDEDCRVSGTIF